MIKQRILSLTLVCLTVCGISTGQTDESVIRKVSDRTPSKIEKMPLKDVREGMKGVARTVFRGSSPEEFNVEIIGVLPGGVGPKQDLIVGKIGSGHADTTGVFSGMSGSPVYIDGKLIGAISFSFPFSKVPYCGITPIEQMIDIFEKAPASRGSTGMREISLAELTATTWNLQVPEMFTSTAAGNDPAFSQIAGQRFAPIATPLTFGGISQRVIDMFAPQLSRVGLVAVSGASGTSGLKPMKTADENTLRGGDSVNVYLTRGDFTMSASGTVTLRDGDKIYAFGHPYLGLGGIDLPMSESSVITVIPSVNNSFKIAVPGDVVGSMTQDRSTGIFGKLGHRPNMIPVRLGLTTSRGQNETLIFEMAQDETLSPLLLNIVLMNSLIAHERSMGNSIIELEAKLDLKDHGSVLMNRRFSGNQALMLASSSASVPVTNLLRVNFGEVDITGIELNLAIKEGNSTAEIERIAIDRNEVKAGEKIELQAFVRDTTGSVSVQRYSVEIPHDTAPGKLTITLADGGAIQRGDAIQRFVPKDLSELIGLMNKVKPNDQLFLRLSRETKGAVVGAKELPNLPPSVIAAYGNDRITAPVSPLTSVVISEMQLPAVNTIITGQQTLSIEVVK